MPAAHDAPRHRDLARFAPRARHAHARRRKARRLRHANAPRVEPRPGRAARVPRDGDDACGAERARGGDGDAPLRERTRGSPAARAETRQAHECSDGSPVAERVRPRGERGERGAPKRARVKDVGASFETVQRLNRLRRVAPVTERTRRGSFRRAFRASLAEGAASAPLPSRVRPSFERRVRRVSNALGDEQTDARARSNRILDDSAIRRERLAFATQNDTNGEDLGSFGSASLLRGTGHLVVRRARRRSPAAEASEDRFSRDGSGKNLRATFVGANVF